MPLSLETGKEASPPCHQDPHTPVKPNTYANQQQTFHTVYLSHGAFPLVFAFRADILQPQHNDRRLSIHLETNFEPISLS